MKGKAERILASWLALAAAAGGVQGAGSGSLPKPSSSAGSGSSSSTGGAAAGGAATGGTRLQVGPSRTRPERPARRAKPARAPGPVSTASAGFSRAELAPRFYQQGLEASDAGDDAVASGRGSEDPAIRAEARARAEGHFRRAAEALEQACRYDPLLHEAWNQLGYARRRLGLPGSALEAYDRALAIHPGYSPALEYRARAHLELGRVDEAKAAYMELFQKDRALADQLEGAMARWLGRRRQRPEGLPATTLDGFEAWLGRRRQLAAQLRGGEAPAGGDW